MSFKMADLLWHQEEQKTWIHVNAPPVLYYSPFWLAQLWKIEIILMGCNPTLFLHHLQQYFRTMGRWLSRAIFSVQKLACSRTRTKFGNMKDWLTWGFTAQSTLLLKVISSMVISHLPVLRAHSFASNWQLAVGTERSSKLFQDQYLRKICGQTGAQTRDPPRLRAENKPDMLLRALTDPAPAEPRKSNHPFILKSSIISKWNGQFPSLEKHQLVYVPIIFKYFLPLINLIL